MNRIAALLLLVLVLTTMSISQNAAPQPPVAKKVHTERTMFGTTLVDDYAWLRDRANPEVKALLEAENAYAERMMEAYAAPAAEALRRNREPHQGERRQRSLPQDGFYYYTRTEKGKQYFVLCRKKGSVDAHEEVLLDLNKMGEGEKFMALGSSDVSDDGNLLAYTTDNVGFRQYKLHVRDLRTGRTLRTRPSASPRSRGPPTTRRFSTSSRTRRPSAATASIATPWEPTPRATPIVYEDKDERFDMGVHRSRSGEFLFLTAGSHITSEVQFLRPPKPDGSVEDDRTAPDNVRVLRRSSRTTSSTSAPTTPRRRSAW
jgi:oligopeptidase B